MESDLIALGVLPEQIKIILDQQSMQAGEFAIWPQNADIFTAFNAVSNQWNVSPAGRLIGLKYESVEAGFRLLGIELTADQFRLFQVLENSVISIINRKPNAR